MQHLYFISGFGADDRVFKDIHVAGYTSHFIGWKKPQKEESLQEYANRMAAEIQHENPVLVGLSFGGIMAIEMAKLRQLSKIILISSIKTRFEKPFYMKMAAVLRLNRILPMKPFPFLDPIENYQLGVITHQQKQLVREYRRNLDQDYADWAIDRILNWNNEWVPDNLVHIHAKNDHIFPIKYIKADYELTGGGHLLVMNKPHEVNEILQKELKHHQP